MCVCVCVTPPRTVNSRTSISLHAIPLCAIQSLTLRNSRNTTISGLHYSHHAAKYGKIKVKAFWRFPTFEETHCLHIPGLRSPRSLLGYLKNACPCRESNDEPADRQNCQGCPVSAGTLQHTKGKGTCVCCRHVRYASDL